jgi:DNA-binding NarL/FixJ family response regulator
MASRAPEPADLLSDKRLTPTHKAILLFMSKGLTNAEIASQLAMSNRSVKYHVSQLFLILDATNRTELVGRLLDLEERRFM